MKKKIWLFAIAALMLSGSVFAAPTTKAGWQYITLSNYYVLPGQNVAIAGNGFAGSRTVTVSAFGTTQTATTNPGGQFTSGSFTVPYSAINSNQTITATDSSGNAASATLTVGTYYPNVAPNSYWIIPGNPVIFTGTGYAPGEVVATSLNGTRLAESTADSSGNFTTPEIDTPFTPGNRTYSFTGQKSGIVRTVTVHVTKNPPYIVLSGYYVAPSNSVTVTGRAFGSREKINLSFDGSAWGTATTNSRGVFTFNGRIPAWASGLPLVVAAGDKTGHTAQAAVTIK